MAAPESDLFGPQDDVQDEQQHQQLHQQLLSYPSDEHARLSQEQQLLEEEQRRLREQGELLQVQQQVLEQQLQQQQSSPDDGEERREKKPKKDKSEKKHKHKHKHKHKKKQKEQRKGGEDEDDETLGGFIERDAEAAIHEDPDDIVPVEGGIESDREVDWTDTAAPTVDPTSFEGALNRLRQRRKKKAKPMDADLQLFCNQMLQKMSEASQQDERSLEAGEPAVAKLQMLDSVCTELVKPKWRHWFVSEGCCQVLAGWLAPFRDDTLPNFSLRQKLLEVLGQLPITAQDLANNDLGKVLVLLWQHDDIGARIYPREYFIVLCGSLTPEAYADETESNRQLIRGLIQKWMRPVLGLGSSHRQFMSERERAFEANDSDLQQKLVKAAQAARQRSEKAEAERASEQQAEKRRRTARVPFNRGHNFLIQPRSQVDFDEAEGKQQAASQQLTKSLRIASRAPRRPTKAAKVSIEGRGL